MARSWEDDARTYRAAGFTAAEVDQERADQERTLREAGFTDQELDDYFLGKPTGDKDADVRAVPPREAKTFLDAFEAGFDNSAVGIAGSRPDVALGPSATIQQRLAAGLGQFVGDLPAAYAGAAGGGAAGAAAGAAATVNPLGALVGGIAGAGAGSAAVPEAIRQAYRSYYEKGGVVSIDDFAQRLAVAVPAVGKAAAVGAVTAGVGQKAKVVAGAVGGGAVSQASAQLAAEGATGVLAPAALEGRLPTKDEVIDAALITLTTHAAVTGATKTVPILKNAETAIMRRYAKTGEAPEAIAERAINDGVFRQEIVVPDPTADAPETVALGDGPGALTVIPAKSADRTPEQIAAGTPSEENIKGRTASFDPTGKVDPEDVVLSTVQARSGRSFNLDDTLTRLYTGLVDETHPIKKVIAAVEGATGEAARVTGEDARVFLQDTGYSASAAERVVKKGFVDAGVKGLDDIVPKDGARLKAFRALVVAKHAIELHDLGIENPTDRTAAERVVQRYAKDADLNQRAADLTSLNNAILDEAVRSDLVSSEKAAEWKEQFKNYVPSQRALSEVDQSVGGAGGGRTVFQAKKKQKGSELDLYDPLENTIVNAYSVYAAAARNRALKSIVDLSKLSPDATEVAESFFEDVTLQRVKVKIDDRTQKALGVPEASVLPDASAYVTVRKELGKDDVLYFEEGKPRVLEIKDPDVLKALQGLDRNDAEFLFKILEAPNRLLRAGVVLSPDFPVVQLFRDNAFQFITDKNSKVPFAELAGGVVSMFKGSKGYARFQEKGGLIGIIQDINKTYGNSREEFIGQYGRGPDSIWRTTRNVVSTPVQLLKAWSDAIATAPRVGTYEREIAAGTRETLARQRARESQIDFKRVGNIGRLINRVIPFFNPSIQALDLLARRVADDPRGTFSKAALIVTVPVLLSWAMYHDEEWYKDSLQRTKDNAVPIRIGDTTYWVPIFPPGIGPLFGGLPRRILDAIFEDDPEAANGFVEGLISGFTPATTVAALQPIVEQISNYSFFKQRPLVSDGLKAALPEDQYTPYTSEAAIKLSAFLSDLPIIEDAKLSPIAIENYVRSWGGSLGAQALTVADNVLRTVDGKPPVPAPTPTADDVPFITRFVTEYSIRNSQAIDNYYQHRRELGELTRSRQLLDKRRVDPDDGESEFRDPKDAARFEKLQKFFDDNEDTLDTLKEADKALKAHRDLIYLVRQARTVEETESVASGFEDAEIKDANVPQGALTPDDKRRLIDLLEHNSIAIAKAANMAYNSLADEIKSNK